MTNVEYIVDPSMVNIIGEEKGEHTVLLDHAVVYRDVHDTSFAWLVEVPEVLEYLFRGRLVQEGGNGAEYDFLGDLFDKLENKTNKFSRLYTCDKRLLKYDCVRYSPPPFSSWITGKNCKLYEKSKLVYFVKSPKRYTKLQNDRVTLADNLITDGVCEVFGRAYTPVENKVDALSDYMFSVAIENVVAPGYHTEKILDCFRTGTVPIYIGDPELDSFDSNGVIRASGIEEVQNIIQSKLDKKLYDNMMPFIKNNFEVAMGYDNSARTIYKNMLRDWRESEQTSNRD